MLPVVDTNWHPARHDNADEFHILRAVAVQSAMTYLDAQHNLRMLCDHAQTPGLGGLPQAIVVYHDFSGPDSIAQLQMLVSNDRVRGISTNVMTDAQANADSLSACMLALGDRGLSIDLAGEIGHVIAASQRLQEYAAPIVCNVSQCSINATVLGPAMWAEAMLPLAGNPLVTIKLSELPATISQDELACVIRQLVDSFGVDRMVFGSAGSTVCNAQHPGCWQQFDDAMQWASASDRDSLFRQNAIQLYRL